MQNTSVIRLVQGRPAWHAPGSDAQPRWLDEERALQDLRASLAQRRSGVIFAAPGAEVRLVTLPVTPAEKKHIGKALPYTLEEQVAQDVEELHFAHGFIDRNTLGVAICSRERMQAWQEALADIPGVARWLPEPLLLPWREGEWCLVLEQDTAIVRTGICGGFSIERDMAPALLEGAASEGELPAAVIVYGRDQAADVALLPEILRDRIQWRAGNLYAAMLLSEDGALKLNLLQGHFAARLPLERWWRQWRPVAAAFAVAFALQLGAGYADYRELRAQNLALRGAVEESYRSVFPRGQVVDAEKQLSRQLDALRGTAQSGGFVSLVDQVGAAVAGMPNTSIDTLNYNDRAEEMRLNILAADFESVERLRGRINETGLEAIMESSSAQGDQVRARLRVGKRS